MLPDLIVNVRRAIAITTEGRSQATDQELLDAFGEAGIGKEEAGVILVFLPIAACRRMLPAVRWMDNYQELDRTSEKMIPRNFSETPAYQAILSEVDRYFETRPGGDNVLKLAGRSSEFHAINDMLNKGWKFDDIRLTPMVILL